jgi:hypothetical protein
MPVLHVVVEKLKKAIWETPHIVSINNTDVMPDAGIDESKLHLNYPTHENIPGPPGADGKDGADSTIPGPPGTDSTVPGPQGEPGTQGVQGIQGNTGADSTVPGPKGDPGTTTWAGITDKPSTFTPSSHTHEPSEITGTAVVNADSRLSDARTPIAHNQAISTVTNLQTSLDAKSNSGHTHSPSEVTGTAVVTSDARLSDARTPTTHSHAPGDVTGTAVVTADSRLSDARVPTTHDSTKHSVTYALPADITTHAALKTGAHGHLNSVRIRPQVTPSAKTSAVTLTIAELLTGIITGNPGAAAAYTLPTGTLCEGGVTMAVDEAFDWVLINIATTATYIITLTAGTGHTIVGGGSIPANSTTTGGLWGTNAQTFRTRKTATNTFVTYRIG